MGSYSKGVYVPAVGETGWGEEINDFLTVSGRAYIDVTAAPYGADSSGATDATDAINAAIVDAYRTFTSSSSPQSYVYIPAGFYRIEGTIQGNLGVNIKGSGPTTVLLPFNGTDPVMASLPDAGFWTVSDLCIGRPSENIMTWGGAHGYYTDPLLQTTGTGHGIYVDRGTRTMFRNILFSYLQGTTTWCIFLDSSLEGQIDNCTTLSCAGGGFKVGGTVNPSNASSVRNCVMSNGGMGALGAILLEATGTLVDNCVVEGWRGDYGIRIKSATASGISGHILNRIWFEDVSGVVVDVDGSGITGGVQSCDFLACGFSPRTGAVTDIGLRVRSSQKINFTSCTFGYGIGGNPGTVLTSELVSGRGTTVRFMNCGGDMPDITGLINTGEDQIITIGCSNALSLAANGGEGLSISRGDLVLGLDGNSFVQMKRRLGDSDPTASPTDNVRLYVKNSGGKTKLYALFATGAAQVIATEP